MLPTPTARDWKSGKASAATLARNARPLSEHIGGSLNPDWVEWLMGWPVGWTLLEPLTDSPAYDWRTDPADTGQVPRVAGKTPHRVERLRAIGNGQVPQCMSLAFRILTTDR